jgi:nitrite reductase/ring-hydroxylating ferredoxin subunit
MRLPVLGLDRLNELDSRAIPLPDGTGAFVVKHHGVLHAYANRCPHWGVDLDFGFGDFVDRRVGRVFCRNHAAEFEPDTGRCVRGPCIGKYLDRIALVSEGEGHALVLDPRSEPDT